MSSSQYISRPIETSSQSRKSVYTSMALIWAFVRGGIVPILALVLSVLVSVGLGVMAAEDWDGFAQRIDFGKMIAFYLSLLLSLIHI